MKELMRIVGRFRWRFLLLLAVMVAILAGCASPNTNVLLALTNGQAEVEAGQGDYKRAIKMLEDDYIQTAKKLAQTEMRLLMVEAEGSGGAMKSDAVNAAFKRYNENIESFMERVESFNDQVSAIDRHYDAYGRLNDAVKYYHQGADWNAAIAGLLSDSLSAYTSNIATTVTSESKTTQTDTSGTCSTGTCTK